MRENGIDIGRLSAEPGDRRNVAQVYFGGMVSGTIFVTSDLTDATQGVHVHFESIAPDGRVILENSHVGITNP
jgi:hypothetical protein